VGGRSPHPPKAAAGLLAAAVLRLEDAPNRHGTVTTPQFIAARAAESVDRILTQFFNLWIYQADKPAEGSW
jgi:hypothetical protein